MQNCEAKTDRTERRKDKSIIIAADFNTPYSTTDKTTGQKVIRMEDLNNSTNQ